MAPAFESADARNKLQDLSGVVIKPGENPYQALIGACDNDPAKVQTLYETHRTARNAQQRAKFLDPAFAEVITDPVLQRIENPSIDPTFADERHGLVFWARPPQHVLQLASHLQGRLKEAAPHLWLMPPQCMHMTALEITHSKTPEESNALVQTMKAAVLPAAATGEPSPANGIASLANYPYRHRARLIKPMLSYDLMAIALSFVPAAGEPSTSPPPVPPSTEVLEGEGSTSSPGHPYTYHHLRRDLFNLASDTGIEVASRYVVPSAHITLGRFLEQTDHATPEARQAWVDKLDEINAWLEKEVWNATWVPAAGQVPPEPSRRFVGEWVVGQERGLDARTGALWYGGGRSVMVGEGF